jgi:hypothetical protein
MQQLIQNISTQIADFYIFLSRGFSDFFYLNCSKNQNKLLFFFGNIVFSQLLTINAQTFEKKINEKSLWEQGQEGHYIQPSNLSSALVFL